MVGSAKSKPVGRTKRGAWPLDSKGNLREVKEITAGCDDLFHVMAEKVTRDMKTFVHLYKDKYPNDSNVELAERIVLTKRLSNLMGYLIPLSRELSKKEVTLSQSELSIISQHVLTKGVEAELEAISQGKPSSSDIEKKKCESGMKRGIENMLQAIRETICLAGLEPVRFHIPGRHGYRTAPASVIQPLLKEKTVLEKPSPVRVIQEPLKEKTELGGPPPASVIQPPLKEKTVLERPSPETPLPQIPAGVIPAVSAEEPPIIQMLPSYPPVSYLQMMSPYSSIRVPQIVSPYSSIRVPQIVSPYSSMSVPRMLPSHLSMESPEEIPGYQQMFPPLFGSTSSHGIQPIVSLKKSSKRTKPEGERVKKLTRASKRKKK